MPLVLNIETSSPICSVCLAKDGEVIAHLEDASGNSHARVLTVFIEQLMQKTGLTLAAIDAVAVSAGPGSYTGLRIGAATAKGICYALNKPLIGVPTLLSLAGALRQQVNDANGFYLPLLDARRMDVYLGLYNATDEALIEQTAATANEALVARLSNYGKIYAGGSGAEKCKAVFTTLDIQFIASINCDARHLAPYAEMRAQLKQFEDLAYFDPLYLKEFGAKN